MQNLLFTIAIILSALVLGQLIYKNTLKNSGKHKGVSDKIIFSIRNFSFFFLNPILVILSFWIVDFSNISIISVPFIGLGALIFGSILAVITSKTLKHDKKSTGAMFCLGSSTNLGTIGSLLCFAALGEIGFAYCALYRILEPPYYYTVLYPVASSYSQDEKKQEKSLFKKLITDPILIIYISSIIIGSLLNYFGIPRPEVISKFTSILIPLNSFNLILAIGYTMRLNRVSDYKKEVFWLTSIKYLFTPIIVITCGIIFGINTLPDKDLFKTLIIMSALPCGFNSLIPVQMYKLNLNLANSCWIVTTGFLLVAYPIIWFIISFI